MKNKKLVQVIGVVLLLIVGFYLVFKLFLFELLLNKALERYEERYQINIAIEKIVYSGSKTFSFYNTTVVPNNADTLLSIAELRFNLRIWPLFIKKIRFNDISITDFRLHLVQTDASDNFSYLLKRNEVAPSQFKTSTNYAKTAHRLLELFFEVIPEAADIQALKLIVEKEHQTYEGLIPEFKLKNQAWSSQLLLIEKQDTSRWQLNGKLNADEELASVQIKGISEVPKNIPYLEDLWKLQLRFDSASVQLKSNAWNQHRLILEGEASCSNLVINQWRISPDNVRLAFGKLAYSISIDARGLSLIEPSVGTVNQLEFEPRFSYRSDQSKQYSIQFSIPSIDFQEFVNSIPEGIFQSIVGMKAQGNLQYQMNFTYNTAQADSLQFESDLDIEKLRIQRYGLANLSKMNADFVHTVYRDDRYIRSIHLSDSNSNFTRLNQVSPFLIEAILVSEDGQFMTHKGFHEEAFRQSIAQNLKEKRFARGGSTITMQLVKNVFLSQQKNVARKAEEALLVWMIENYRLVSKERMLEVYLNIIEWGPNVYGVKEASQFYFSKNPKELGLEESLYLAMIIPRPRYFMYNFDENAELKSFTNSYFSLITRIMEKRQKVEVVQQDSIASKIRITGPALQSLIKTPSDSLPPIDDTLLDFIFIDN